MLTLLADVTDLVLPRACGGCGRPGSLWCPRCRPAGPPFVVPGPSGERGGAGIEAGIVAGLVVVAAAVYDDGVRRALIRYKERGRRDLAAPLGSLLRAAITTLDPPPGTTLVAPPAARAAVAARGGDHVLRLARRALRAGPPAPAPRLRAAPGVLSSVRRVRDSAGLGVAERRRNLAGSMAATPGHGRPVMIVDDIVTTGATLREARRALQDAGWSLAGAAVVAATPRRVMPHPLAGLT